MWHIFLLADGTETIAYGPDSDGYYYLHGYKWFTSATDANMAFTLARIVSKHEEITAVSGSLLIFVVKIVLMVVLGLPLWYLKLKNIYDVYVQYL